MKWRNGGVGGKHCGKGGGKRVEKLSVRQTSKLKLTRN